MIFFLSSIVFQPSTRKHTDRDSCFHVPIFLLKFNKHINNWLCKTESDKKIIKCYHYFRLKVKILRFTMEKCFPLSNKRERN